MAAKPSDTSSKQTIPDTSAPTVHVRELGLMCLRRGLQPVYVIDESGNNFVGDLRVGNIEVKGGHRVWVSKRLAKEWLARAATPEVLKLPELPRKKARKSDDPPRESDDPIQAIQTRYQVKRRRIEEVVEGGPLYTTGTLGQRYTCVVKIPGVDKIFGDVANRCQANRSQSANAFAYFTESGIAAHLRRLEIQAYTEAKEAILAHSMEDFGGCSAEMLMQNLVQHLLLRKLDIELMKRLSPRVNVIPVSGKADSLTPTELAESTKLVMEDIEHYRIPVYNYPYDIKEDDEDTVEENAASQSHMPFTIVGSMGWWRVFYI
ncbi:hypothetical protein MMC22_003490 [Lobaria immixta]|nr:hypothetical protein [Lobaria immixta]